MTPDALKRLTLTLKNAPPLVGWRSKTPCPAGGADGACGAP